MNSPNNPWFCEPINDDEVKEVLKKMSNGKANGLNQIMVEAWKCLGEQGLKWLIEFFNVIFRTAKMPKEWKFSIVIPLYKNKDDIQDCNNFRV